MLHYRKPLILCVEKQLVGEHLQEILNKGHYGVVLWWDDLSVCVGCLV
jgi:hypothetical protein